jgi:YD repeat-containing protein
MKTKLLLLFLLSYSSLSFSDEYYWYVATVSGNHLNDGARFSSADLACDSPLSPGGHSWLDPYTVVGVVTTKVTPPQVAVCQLKRIGSSREFNYAFRVTQCSGELVINPSMAASCIIPPPDTVDEPKNTGTCCQKEGNPINVGTGNKFDVHTDYTGTGSFPLVLQRIYNSNDSVASTRIGQHWRHSYDKVISNTSAAAVVNVYRADGKVLNFILFDSNWRPDADITDQLVELKDVQSQRIGWQYTTSDDIIETYDVDGKLILLTNRAGLTQTLDYELTLAQGGDDDSSTLDKVTDAFGRTISFSYDTAGRIITIHAPGGEEYAYGYDGNNNLNSVSYPDETSGDNTDNPTRIYHYENTNFVHALTGITDETGQRYATYAYDSEGRAVMSEHAGSAQRIELTYNADGTTSVVDSIGRSQTYHFEVQHGVVKVGQIDGGLCTTCSNTSKNTTYDTNGFVASRTDFNDNVTTYINDTRGLELSRTEAVGTPEERTITTEWDLTFRLPIKITEPGKITTLTYDSQGRFLERKEEKAQ